MPDDPIHRLLAEERADRVVVRVLGEVDHSNAREIEDELRGFAGKLVVVDLSEASYFDSAGIAMMFALRRDTDLAVVAPVGSIVRRALDITGFDQIVPMFSSVDEPIAAQNF
jgi:anti-anti-sigma factor